jgi:ribonuclease P protein component
MDRLRQRADFLAVANGARISTAGFVVQARRRDDDGPIRLGFTVTKKNGTATERNRIRRRLRAALTCEFSKLLEDFRQALHRLDRQALKPRDAKNRRDANNRDE